MSGTVKYIVILLIPNVKNQALVTELEAYFLEESHCYRANSGFCNLKFLC